jgi:hypothetical protein
VSELRRSLGGRLEPVPSVLALVGDGAGAVLVGEAERAVETMNGQTDKVLYAVAWYGAQRAYANIKSTYPHAVPQLLVSGIYAALEDAQRRGFVPWIEPSRPASKSIEQASRRGYDGTVARIAGNLLSHAYPDITDNEGAAREAVKLARAIVAETRATEPGASAEAFPHAGPVLAVKGCPFGCGRNGCLGECWRIGAALPPDPVSR